MFRTSCTLKFNTYISKAIHRAILADTDTGLFPPYPFSHIVCHEMAEIPTLVPAISGAIGSSIASFSFFPLDIVVVRQQVQRSGRITPHEQASIVETLKHIIAREGWCTLYKGCFDDLLGTFLQSFLYFYAYEYLRTGHIRSMRRKGARF